MRPYCEECEHEEWPGTLSAEVQELHRACHEFWWAVTDAVEPAILWVARKLDRL